MLHIAQNKATGDSKDIYVRSAISRAYYSVFWIAREYSAVLNGGFTVVQDPSETKKKGSHELVIGFIRDRDPDLGDALFDLKEFRHEADYDLLLAYDLKVAQDAIALAEELLNYIYSKLNI